MLRMENVTYIYEDKTRALDDVTIDLSKNRITGIVGSNGAGKSTMFMNFVGLKKPTQGKIYFRDKPLKYDKKSLRELRLSVGIVFQDPDKQIFFSSVYDDIAFGLRNLKYSEDYVQKAVKQAMEKTNTVHLKDKPVHFLSYGQKKNVSIAGTLAMNAQLIFFDEPTAGLDYVSRQSVKSILTTLADEGKNIVISSHNMDFIYEMSTYIYVLNKGLILAEGTPAEVFTDKKILDQASLEEPFLIKAHKYLGLPLCKTEAELFSNHTDKTSN